MNRRPKDWEDIPVGGIFHRNTLTKVIKIKDIEEEERAILELGADAILEAIKREERKGGLLKWLKKNRR